MECGVYYGYGAGGFGRHVGEVDDLLRPHMRAIPAVEETAISEMIVTPPDRRISERPHSDIHGWGETRLQEVSIKGPLVTIPERGKIRKVMDHVTSRTPVCQNWDIRFICSVVPPNSQVQLG